MVCKWGHLINLFNLKLMRRVFVWAIIDGRHVGQEFIFNKSMVNWLGLRNVFIKKVQYTNTSEWCGLYLSVGLFTSTFRMFPSISLHRNLYVYRRLHYDIIDYLTKMKLSATTSTVILSITWTSEMKLSGTGTGIIRNHIF